MKMSLSERFKGEGNPFYGRRHTEESKMKIVASMQLKREEINLRISEAKRGKKLSDEHKEAIGLSLRGKKRTIEQRLHCKEVSLNRPKSHNEGISKSLTGKKKSPEHIRKIVDARRRNGTYVISESRRSDLSKAFSGVNNPSWKGGISKELYGIEFNDELKEQIRNRDDRACCECGVPEMECLGRLIVHHIDYNKRNNSEYNLISLCRSCHGKTQVKRNYWKNHFAKLLNREVVL